MANEILAASSDFLVSSVLEMEILTKLSSLINLRGSPALVDFSPMAARGSLTLAIPLAGWDSLVMTAPGEATGVSNTALDSDQNASPASVVFGAIASKGTSTRE